MINIAILGHGVVGSGVVEVIETNKLNIIDNLGDEINVKRILDIREFDVSYKEKFTKNFSDILDDEEISIVVEVMGGVNPAYDFVKAAMKHKKSVVTSNKELVAQKGAKLLKIAKDNEVNFYFEASVGGGIPIIRPLHKCLAANEITKIAGILNGTTNYILTQMINHNVDFASALKSAQELGYAESNPTADVDGHDTCRKICILTSLAYKKHIYPENVFTKGISDITLDDVAYAQDADSVIKLIGYAQKINSDDDKNIECWVSPAFVDKSSQLAGIDDVYNGILVAGNALGDVVFYGRGAGKLPTASAVVADVIDVANHVQTNSSLYWEDEGVNRVMEHDNTNAKYYIKVSSCDNNDFEQIIEREFGKVKYLKRENQAENEYAFIVEVINKRALVEKEKILSDNNIEVINKMPVLNI